MSYDDTIDFSVSNVIAAAIEYSLLGFALLFAVGSLAYVLHHVFISLRESLYQRRQLALIATLQLHEAFEYHPNSQLIPR
jgi:hypothetical protein